MEKSKMFDPGQVTGITDLNLSTHPCLPPYVFAGPASNCGQPSGLCDIRPLLPEFLSLLGGSMRQGQPVRSAAAASRPQLSNLDRCATTMFCSTR